MKTENIQNKVDKLFVEKSCKNTITLQIVAKENHFTLELPTCSAEDSGQYTCRVSDAAGANVTCSAQLEVHQRKRLFAPQISTSCPSYIFPLKYIG